MKNYSLTQGGIVVAVAGTLLMQAGFSGECTSEIITNVPVLAGGFMAWFGRYRKGDLTIAGFRKEV